MMHNSHVMDGDIFSRIASLRSRGERAVLATIISRKGSTPRKVASKMLVYEDGRQEGTIGGGCAEAEVIRESLGVLRTEKCKLIRLDLSEDDAEAGGLICGGAMEVFMEPLIPDPHLIILGGGHIGRCLATAAANAGFLISVADDRIKYASRERFPMAERLYSGDWSEMFQQIPITPSTFLVIATRGHKHDLASLRHAVGTQACYIGLLGSRRKVRILFDTLLGEGVAGESLERVSAPVGLYIGSDTPEEIAVSIVAELIAVRKGVDVTAMKRPTDGSSSRSICLPAESHTA